MQIFSSIIERKLPSRDDADALPALFFWYTNTFLTNFSVRFWYLSIIFLMHLIFNLFDTFTIYIQDIFEYNWKKTPLERWCRCTSCPSATQLATLCHILDKDEHFSRLFFWVVFLGCFLCNFSGFFSRRFLRFFLQPYWFLVALLLGNISGFFFNVFFATLCHTLDKAPFVFVIFPGLFSWIFSYASSSTLYPCQ